MSHDKIVVVGARENNLKNITVEIPRDKLVVITGLSGSGKSSLAFDTIYAEGQRRYVESLSAYARQFLGQMDKPDVDHVDGLSPAISIDQKSASKNPRSTVGTVTEIYDYLRILFARIGTPYCPNGHGAIERQSTDTIVDEVLRMAEGTRIQILAPVIRGRKGEYKKELKEVQQAGFVRVRVDGEMYEVTDDIPMDRYKQHTIEVVVDRLIVKEGIDRRLADSVETALKMGKGLVTLVSDASDTSDTSDKSVPSEKTFSEHYSCPECGFSMQELEPRVFSFNSPYGACPECTGLGTRTEFDVDLVVPDRSKPLRDGAIIPFVYKSGEVKEWWPDVLDGVGLAVGFDSERPVSEMTPEQFDAVWNGLSDPIKVTMHYGKTARTFNYTWDGVLKVMRKKLDQTESEWVKNDLAQYMRTRPCPACGGARLKPESLSVRLPGEIGLRRALSDKSDMSDSSDVVLQGVSIADVTALPVDESLGYCLSLTKRFNTRQRAIGERAIKEIVERLRFLFDVGLGYLTLDRNTNTLAGGEAQRIRLATQIGSGLMGCLYVLDEPSVGLHQRDNHKLIETLKRLRDLGNTVLVVEHDEDTMRSADWLIDLGPGAGEHGGYIVNEGTLETFLKNDSPTSRYLTGKEKIDVPTVRRSTSEMTVTSNGAVKKLIESKRDLLVAEKSALVYSDLAEGDRVSAIVLKNATGNNLRGIDVAIPLGKFVCVTGVSGSGKSTLVQDTLFPRLMYEVYGSRSTWAPHDALEGHDALDKVIDIDQSPIGRTPRSNPATYTGTFDMIRELFAKTPDSKIKGFKNGRFSFNVKGGRCEACKGDGIIKIEMHFLPDVYVPCEVCKGKRYNRETLEVKYKGKSIADVLGMTIEEACMFFQPIPKIHRKLVTLMDVGLGYVRMGQPATTLSGGEAQRVKLAEELSKRSTGRTMYILDEPTTGLHFEDVRRLLTVLHRLVDQGNTVLVIEHNLDVIKTADWVIDLGPEGGTGGGYVVASGTPEDVAKVEASFTGQFLKPLLAEAVLR